MGAAMRSSRMLPLLASRRPSLAPAWAVAGQRCVTTRAIGGETSFSEEGIAEWENKVCCIGQGCRMHGGCHVPCSILHQSQQTPGMAR